MVTDDMYKSLGTITTVPFTVHTVCLLIFRAPWLYKREIAWMDTFEHK
jgi:hypothetical protein